MATMVLAHIDVLSSPFTAAMPQWQLQCESVHWCVSS